MSAFFFMPFQVEDDEKLDTLTEGHHSVVARPYLCTGYDIYLVWEPCTM
jgi:tRNA-specific adenosine deaminase 3